MILDPTSNSLEVFYDGKLRNLVGFPEDILAWVVDLCSILADEWYEDCDYDDAVWGDDYELKYKGCDLVQITIPYLDVNNFGKLWVRLFSDIGFQFKELDVKRIDL